MGGRINIKRLQDGADFKLPKEGDNCVHLCYYMLQSRGRLPKAYVTCQKFFKIDVSGEFCESTDPTKFRTMNSTEEPAGSQFLLKLNATYEYGSDTFAGCQKSKT